jgi:hypothetical protein
MMHTIVPPGGTFPASNGTSRTVLCNQNTERYSSTVDHGEQPAEANDCLAAVATLLRQYLESVSRSDDNAISTIPDSEITNSPSPAKNKRPHKPSLDDAPELTGRIKRQKQSHGVNSECAVSTMGWEVPDDPDEDAESGDAESEDEDEDADAGSENEDTDAGNEDHGDNEGNEGEDVQNKQHEGETNGDVDIQERDVQDKQHAECDSEGSLKHSKPDADKIAARRVVNKIRSGLKEMGQQTSAKGFESWSTTGKESQHALCIRIEKTLWKQGSKAMKGGREMRWMHRYLSSCFALARIELFGDELVDSDAPMLSRTEDRWRSSAHMMNMIVEGLRDSWGGKAELVYHALAGNVLEALLRLLA